ncbi:PPK2 family polyphosphate kinase [Bdellovibrio svalbardensis]|uniref:Deoxynucleoside kinase n=1 Tax=Bdellovibrio svalbardensis TaxID=2972972 RepID=A0ABT6DL28_9BACT|nr:PPK2 family polyphosphate kinase [Bdellovibrio svalbardensis]MDG0817585.1 deoxynucleoside kinase [Bdellovibrio svalbardensis]
MTKEKHFFLGNKRLASFPTKGEQFVKLNNEDLETKTHHLGERLADLQEVLFAENKYKILIVLQGLDTSGKDGTVKHVFGATNPQGVRVVSFKAPTELEQSHDYLWRVHKALPANGEMVIFNRSHYEDYVVPKVHKSLPAKTTTQRLKDIYAFEKMLTNENTVIFKFFLNISLDEQARRLQQRLENDNKHWKFSLSDLTERRYWKEYHKAYEEVIRATHSKESPWAIIPADNKGIRNYIISKILVDRLESLHPKLPKFDSKVIRQLKAEADRILPKQKPL